MQVGENVQQGMVISMSGNTGNSSAPHMHFHALNQVQRPLLCFSIEPHPNGWKEEDMKHFPASTDI